MLPSSCGKCGGTSFHTNVKGNNTGLYCDACGSWIKWLSKPDLKAFKAAQGREQVAPVFTKPGVKDMSVRLSEFLAVLNKRIDAEYAKLPSSNEDAIRKNSYCHAVQQDIWALENILNGRDWNAEA